MMSLRSTARRMAVRAAVGWLRWTSPMRPRLGSPPVRSMAVIGFVNSASGLGAAARGLVDALEPWGANALCLSPFAPTPRLPARGSGLTPVTMDDRESDVGIHVYNPDIFLGLVRRYGGRLLACHRFNVAVVNWETDTLPPAWPDVLSLYGCLAAPSSFTAAAVRRATGRRVHVIPNCVPLQPLRMRPRVASRVEFLCLFDHHSDIERKNPLAAIRAFRRACVDLPPDVAARLRVKCHANTPPDLAERLLEEAGTSCVEILRATLSGDDMHRLWQETDCLVSLHRSEGFGLPVAEALARGIPVVTTRQGGILDFTDEECCQFVDGGPAVKHGSASGYAEWSGWIEPDIAAAAAAMRRVMTRYDEAVARAVTGRRRFEATTSPAAVRRSLLVALQEEGVTVALPLPAE